MKVLFICTGNTCRSPMAEGILKKLSEEKNLDFDVSSAGISVFGPTKAAENSIKALKEMDIDIENHTSRMVEEDILKDSDLILTMSESHKRFLEGLDIEYKELYTLLEYIGRDRLDIADPFGGSLDVYIKTRDEIYEAIEELIEKWEKN